MIPTTGDTYELNQTATYLPAEGGSTVPTVLHGGIRVSIYVDDNGTFTVSIATDEDDLDPAIHIGRGEEGAVAMNINVNDTRVFTS